MPSRRGVNFLFYISPCIMLTFLCLKVELYLYDLSDDRQQLKVTELGSFCLPEKFPCFSKALYANVMDVEVRMHTQF